VDNVVNISVYNLCFIINQQLMLCVKLKQILM